MIKKIKSEISLLKVEKEKSLIELGKILKNNNIVELKNLNHYPNLKLAEKELCQMKSNLSKSEENENILKNLNKKIYILKTEYKSINKSYKKNLKEIAKTIIEIYPQNLELLKIYKKNQIKNEINAIVKNKENILKKIAEEFIETTKKEKTQAKTNTISAAIQKIEKTNQKILNLSNDLIKITKQEEIKNIQKKMQVLTKEKDKINNKLDALTSKIEVIQNELDNE
uniref:hypothetical protein n=1 Tax=Borreliella garinii TaxID=29519 RepID=UPI0022775CDA|nr:hypothetical protein [Borreliella garinii]